MYLCTHAFMEKYSYLFFLVFDNFTREVTVDGHKKVNLCFHDTAGQEGYDRLRPLAYRNTDIFLICFSVDNLDSLRNIETTWAGEVKQHCPKAKLIMVGLKQDLRNSNPRKCLDSKIAKKIFKNIDAAGYLECSAKTQNGLYELFDFVIKLMLSPPAPESKSLTPSLKSFKLKPYNKCSLL